MRRADVVIVGAGMAGTATARWLARDKDVVVLEQFEIGHKRGSSHGTSRIFRFSYPEVPFVRAAVEALELWRQTEEESGRPLLTTTGGLDLGDDIHDNATALSECEVPFEMLNGAEASERFPQVHVSPHEEVLYQADGGFAAADASVRTFVDLALASGAELRENERVERIETSADEALVHTTAETFAAPVVVVTAGGWTRDLLTPLGIDLPVRPTRETIAYFDIDEEVFPTLVEWGPPALYSLPSPGQGLKAGLHLGLIDTDPDDEGEPDQGSLDRIVTWVKERFPSANPESHLVETCIYTNTDDERFILERHGPIVIGSACSGHGFKFAPWTGKRLAELASESS